MTDGRRDARDAVVVGGGFGGLSAATFLAKAGADVLLVERSQEVGGCGRGVERGPYRFDLGLGQIPQGAEGELRDGILAHLGVAHRCTLLPLEECYGVRLPGLELRVPLGLEQLIAAHTDLFPGQAGAIRGFFELCHETLEAAHRLPLALSFRELDRAAERFPAYFKYRGSTLGEVLDEHFQDERVKAVCGALWPYVGLPPSKASFSTYAQLLAVMSRGMFYCRGGFQELADGFAASLRELGAEVVLGLGVSQVLLEEGQAAGVRLEDGREISAPVVVSNADATHTFDRLVGRDQLPASALRRLDRMRPSLSGYVLMAASSLDLRAPPAAHENLLYSSWDHEESFRASLRGAPTAAWVTAPTLLDPSVARPGEHVLVARTLVPYALGRPWEEAEKRCREQMLAGLEEAFPGLGNGLTFLETTTPPAIERATGNRDGALYGWEHSPGQTGSRRPALETVVPSLYLCGHWTQPGAGSYRAILSGMHVARIILAKAGRPDAIPEFRSVDVTG